MDNATSLYHNTIITVNERLAVYLQNQHDNRQKQQGKIGWSSPTILSLKQWLLQCYNSISLTPLTPLTPTLQPLTLNQERLVWQTIIASNLANLPNSKIQTYATLAKQAFEVCQQWGIDPQNWQKTSRFIAKRQPIDYSETHATQAFAQWHATFIQHCQQNHWCSQTELIDILIPLFKHRAIQLPRPLLFAGFDQFTPQMQQLIAILRSQNYGATLLNTQPPSTPSQLFRLPLTDTKTEMIEAARWALACYKQNPHQHIACIVPKLTQVRDKIETIFYDVFSPTYPLPGILNASPFPINIGAGKPLPNYPLIYTALILLKLPLQHSNTLSLESISRLLRSPFLGKVMGSPSDRAKIDSKLRHLKTPDIPLNHPLLPHPFRQLAQPPLKLSPSTRRHPSDWIHYFNEVLNHIGWPGSSPLNSQDYQLCKRWLALLQEIANLDTIVGLCTASQTLSYVSDIANNTLFQPKTTHQPIQILGVLEAAGMTFDGLWVMGMHDSAWPTPSHPNPLIPYTLQRYLDLPHASAQREWTFAKTVTQRLKNSSTFTLFSYPQKEKDRSLNPSPLISDLSIAPEHVYPKTSYTAYTHIIQQSSVNALNTLTDHQAPPLNNQELEKTFGSSVFQRQASCPFSAFATCRLNITPQLTPQIGLTALEHGQLVHNVLSIVWGSLGSHANLCQQTDNQLTTNIQSAIESALRHLNQYRLKPLSKSLQQLETTQLLTLITDWLHYEKQRPPFKAITCEYSYQVNFAGLPLSLRIDRIDQLPDNRYVIIDYKTGDASIQSWLGDRPDALQLPLYSLTASPHFMISGIAFGQIQYPKSQFKGIMAHPKSLPNIKAPNELPNTNNNPSSLQNWSSLQTHWHTELHALGQAFLKGDAQVNPKNPKLTCQRCHLHSLCRIHELNP